MAAIQQGLNPDQRSPRRKSEYRGDCSFPEIRGLAHFEQTQFTLLCVTTPSKSRKKQFVGYFEMASIV